MYNPLILQHFTQPHNRGVPPDSDALGQAGTPGDGPYMTIGLCLQDDQIRGAHFETYGCPAAIACGSWLTRWLAGKSTAAAAAVEPRDLSLMLGGLPLGKEHCAEIAVNALRSALRSVSRQCGKAHHIDKDVQ